MIAAWGQGVPEVLPFWQWFFLGKLPYEGKNCDRGRDSVTMACTHRLRTMTAIKTNGRSRQEELGQFLTSVPTADFMASMFGPLPRVVRLLDAGGSTLDPFQVESALH